MQIRLQIGMVCFGIPFQTNSITKTNTEQRWFFFGVTLAGLAIDGNEWWSIKPQNAQFILFAHENNDNAGQNNWMWILFRNLSDAFVRGQKYKRQTAMISS